MTRRRVDQLDLLHALVIGGGSLVTGALFKLAAWLWPTEADEPLEWSFPADDEVVGP